MQNENTTPFQTHPILGPTLKMLEQQKLDYSIHGEGGFIFAFWLRGEERTHFVLTSNIVEYSRYFNYYLEAQSLGECRLMSFRGLEKRGLLD